MDDNDLKNRFTYHPPNSEDKTSKYKEIRAAGYDLASLINSHCPEGREKSLAVTKLEEATFWANASIARSA